MIGFSENTGLQIHLIYYPPYHSKYNPVERCWSNLERHWNGEILNSVDKAIKWASTMTWKGIKASVSLIDKVYEKGFRLPRKKWSNINLKLSVLQIYQNGTLEFYPKLRKLLNARSLSIFNPRDN